MKHKLRNRIGLTLLFSVVIFLTFLISASIVAWIGFLTIRIGGMEQLGGFGRFSLILIVLLASVIIGTIISPILGRIALAPIRKVIAAINRLADGDFTTRLSVGGPPEIRELSNSFNRMAEELGSIELLRTDFINNFSHEFKTPIMSIKGFAEMLKYGDLTEEERNEYLDIVIKESNRLATLATNVLDLSKIEKQTILSDRQEFDLGEQLRRCILMLESKWVQKQLSLSVEIQDVKYIGNEDLLGQVWLNLLDNAVKFTPEGGDISILLEREAENAVFVIHDNGTGISEEAMSHIYEKFYQGDTSHATAGNGLGLTLAKKVIELHGGSIACRSTLCEGTEFTVLLPFA